jgi:hypothetical protein
MEQKKYPKGHFVGMWIGIGMAIFSGVGVSIAVATDNMGLIGIGPALGVGFGAGIGSMIEKKKAEEGLIRDYTEEELIKNKKLKKLTFVLLGLGVAVLAAGIIYKII